MRARFGACSFCTPRSAERICLHTKRLGATDPVDKDVRKNVAPMRCRGLALFRPAAINCRPVGLKIAMTADFHKNLGVFQTNCASRGIFIHLIFHEYAQRRGQRQAHHCVIWLTLIDENIPSTPANWPMMKVVGAQSC